MRLILLASALVLSLPALTLPSLAMADEAPKTEEAAKKPRKFCRETPARTGSHRPGKRVCRTAEEWKELDQADLDYDRTNPGTPLRSQSTTPDR